MTSSRRVPARSRGWIAGVAWVVAVAVLLLAAQSSLSPTTARCHYDGLVAASFAVGVPVVSAHDVGTCRVAASSSDSRHVYDPHLIPERTKARLTSGFLAPRAIGAADDIVRYDLQWASRQLLGQNLPGSSGWAVTPGGRTISAHAAERIAFGGAGRPTTSLSMVDDIVGSGTRVVYDPTRNTIRVIAEKMPGNPYVVVSARDPNHIVTVMAPYG